MLSFFFLYSFKTYLQRIYNLLITTHFCPFLLFHSSKFNVLLWKGMKICREAPSFHCLDLIPGLRNKCLNSNITFPRINSGLQSELGLNLCLEKNYFKEF